MIDLIQLKHYLRRRKVTPLQDMALHFKVEIDVVRPLLKVWMGKGKVRKIEGSSGICGGCCKCDAAAIEIYEWLGEEDKFDVAEAFMTHGNSE